LRTTWARLAVVAALAAGGPAMANTLPDSGEFASERAARGGCDYTDPATEPIFRWPIDWPVRRLKIVTQTGPQPRARQRAETRRIAIEYWPDDDALPRVSPVNPCPAGSRDAEIREALAPDFAQISRIVRFPERR